MLRIRVVTLEGPPHELARVPHLVHIVTSKAIHPGRAGRRRRRRRPGYPNPHNGVGRGGPMRPHPGRGAGRGGGRGRVHAQGPRWRRARQFG